MKRQISISIFLAILVIILALLYVKFSNETKQNKDGVLTEENLQEENILPMSQEYTTYQYYIKDDDGRLAVYETKTQELYSQTGIETDTLPMELQKKLEAGIFFQTEAELYNFLESYSS